MILFAFFVSLSTIFPACGATAAPLPAKDALVLHIRETFGVPAQVPLELGDLKPSGIPGLDMASLTIGAGDQAQKQTVYVSKDGRHYFMSEAQDLKVDPDAVRREKIKLDGAPSRGPEDAPIQLVEFSDFECPYCRQAQLSLEKELEAYKGKVRLVFKTFPLERIHPWAKTAAVAALCAARQKPEAFWTLGDAYFEGQKDITPDNVRAKSLELAAKAKLDSGAFATCIDKAETADIVAANIEEGEKAGVGSTPSFFVNGHPIRGYSSFEPFKELIDEMLAGTHAKPKS